MYISLIHFSSTQAMLGFFKQQIQCLSRDEPAEIEALA